MNYIFEEQFPNNFTKNLLWQDEALQDFHKKAEAYCRFKYFSYQSTGEDMRMIVETCMRLNSRANAIVWFTYREAISRFVSMVNQQCNKSFKIRRAEVQRFCYRCQCRESDDSDNKVLKAFINSANKMYLSISSITQMNLNRVQVLLMDTMELSEFLNALSLELPFRPSRITRNTERTDRCNFCITSKIIKELAPSIGVYQNLTRVCA